MHWLILLAEAVNPPSPVPGGSLLSDSAIWQLVMMVGKPGVWALAAFMAWTKAIKPFIDTQQARADRLAKDAQDRELRREMAAAEDRRIAAANMENLSTLVSADREYSATQTRMMAGIVEALDCVVTKAKQPG